MMKILTGLSNLWEGLTTSQRVAVIAFIVSAVTSILTTLLTSWLTSRRGRRHTLWERDVDRVEKVKQLVDDISVVISFTSIPTKKEKEIVGDLLVQFEEHGSFEEREKFIMKYKGLKHAMDDFLNAIYYYLDLKKVDPEFKQNYQSTLTELYSACDLVIKGKGK